jgi:hypothetical protein
MKGSTHLKDQESVQIQIHLVPLLHVIHEEFHDKYMIYTFGKKFRYKFLQSTTRVRIRRSSNYISENHEVGCGT